MQLSEIRDWVRQQTLVEADDFADAKLNAVINQGVRDLSTLFRWPFLATSSTVAMVADQQAYAMPADLQSIEKVVVTGEQRTLSELSPARAWGEYGGKFGTATVPESFFIWGSSLYMVPIPTDATKSITLYYYRFATELTNDTSVPEWAAPFHQILAEYAAAHVWEREEDFPKARDFWGRYFQGVDRMAQFYLNRSADKPMVVGGSGAQHTTSHPWPNMPWLEVV